jgi:hypothetical protein
MKTPSMRQRPMSAARQFSLTFDPERLRVLSPADRAAAVLQLAVLLTEAAGVAAGEHDDDKR